MPDTRGCQEEIYHFITTQLAETIKLQRSVNIYLEILPFFIHQIIRRNSLHCSHSRKENKYDCLHCENSFTEGRKRDTQFPLITTQRWLHLCSKDQESSVQWLSCTQTKDPFFTFIPCIWIVHLLVNK